MNPLLAGPTITLVPGERFFLKEIALDPAVPTATQVELALEESSPFPLAQLYHGFVAGSDGQHALGFAAYRRRFTAEEVAEWAAATAVLPDFLALLGPAPTRPLLVVHVHAGGVTGMAWDGRAVLPRSILLRAAPEPTESHVGEVVAELRRRSGVTEADVRRLDGPAGAGVDEAGNIVLRVAGVETARFPAVAIASADIRDKSFLEEKRQDDARRRGWMWGLTAAAVLLLTAAGLDMVAGGLAWWNGRRRATVAAQADEVRRIENALALATRIEDLSARQEKPLEWLSLAASLRPRSVQFVRVVSNNDRSLAIDAQTTDAAAVGAYESTLRQRKEIAGVEMREIRSREGVTTFALVLTFKPGGRMAEEGTP